MRRGVPVSERGRLAAGLLAVCLHGGQAGRLAGLGTSAGKHLALWVVAHAGQHTGAELEPDAVCPYTTHKLQAARRQQHAGGTGRGPADRL